MNKIFKIVVGTVVLGWVGKNICNSVPVQYIKEAVTEKMSKDMADICMRERRRPIKSHVQYSIKGVETADDVIFDTREDAERVLYNLSMILFNYGCANIMDFYMLANITPENTDYAVTHGWTDLTEARVYARRIGHTTKANYSISFPKPEKI